MYIDVSRICLKGGLNFVNKLCHCHSLSLSLKNRMSGWNEISAGIYKSYIDLYIKPLTFLINTSINQDIFPDTLKTTKVVPIYKSGDKADISNYRPISILTYF